MKQRTFIRNAFVGSAALSGLTILSTGCSSHSKLKDNFWLWWQNPGSHHVGSPAAGYKLPGKNLMDAREG